MNDIHVGEWAKIITNSTPPVPRTPLTPYAQTYRFGERGCALDGTKLKEVRLLNPYISPGVERFSDVLLPSKVPSF